MRPLLFRLDPEAAHDAALRAMSWLARHPRAAALVRRWVARPVREPVRLMGMRFPHRIGLAAGFDKSAVAPLAWWAIGFGFMELGTVTPRPQPGQPRPRMFRLARARGLVNRMGFNNDGASAAAARLSAAASAGLRPPCPIGVSVGKNAATPAERAAEDFAAAAAAVAPHADFLTLNISSPNTPGLRDLQERRAIAALLNAVRGAAAGRPVLVKLAPELDAASLAPVVDACLEGGAAGIIATNTLATVARGDLARRLGLDGLPAGGLSGRPIRAAALRRVEQVRRLVGGRGVVIGCGGIADIASARAMLNAGADLLQMYTALVYEGPFVAARLSREVARLRGGSAASPRGVAGRAWSLTPPGTGPINAP